MFNLTEALGPNKSGERGSTGCNNAQVAPPMMQQAPRPSCVPNCHPWQPCTGQLLNSFYLHLKPTAEDLLLPPFHLQVFKLLPSPLDLLPLRIGLRSKWTVRAWSRGGKSHRAPQRPSGQPRAVAPVRLSFQKTWQILAASILGFGVCFVNFSWHSLATYGIFELQNYAFQPQPNRDQLSGSSWRFCFCLASISLSSSCPSQETPQNHCLGHILTRYSIYKCVNCIVIGIYFFDASV